jgi:hypothetical protein
MVHRATDLERADTTVHQGIPVTDPMRTLVDLAAVAPVGTVARSLYRALSSRLATFEATEASLQRVARKGRRGVRVLRVLLDEQHDNPRPAGVFEARFSSLARRFVLPTPVPELDVLADDGRWIARVDFAYPEAKLFIELDGLEAHGSGSALQHDHQRQNALVEARWEPLRYTWADVTRRQSAVAAEVRRVRHGRLRLLGARDHRDGG